MKHYTVEVWEDKDRMGGMPCLYGTRLLLETLGYKGLRKFKKDYPATKKNPSWKLAIKEIPHEK